ncbi:MAG: flavin reductase family protein [Deltaproteobacteria bacterium]|nr:flavin reductase family protein [Deltaproteobacteria bacterium]
MPSPNPQWKPGDTVEAPPGKTIELDPTKIPAKEIYKLIIGSIVPRPIAFVSTISAGGVTNLAPFSFFNGVSSNPPCVMISISNKEDGSKKDTLRNIEETKQFVVNSANEWLAEPLVHTAASFPYGVDEMSVVGLTAEPSLKVKPPRVKESAFQMECELYKTVEIGDGSAGSTTVIFGKILFMHAHESVYKDGRILFSEYKAIGRLGGFSYGRVTETFDIPVPRVGSDGPSGG